MIRSLLTRTCLKYRSQHLERVPVILFNRLSTTSGGRKQKKPVLRLLTKKHCTLCEEAKEVLWAIPGIRQRLDLVEVDILKEGNEDFFGLYRYEIPVFFLGKKFVSKNRLDTEKLLELLEREENADSIEE